MRSHPPIDTDWPVEINLLFVCARLHLKADDVERIREILRGQLDWKRVCRLTVLHRLTAFMVTNLNLAASDLVQEQHMEFLRGLFIQDGAAGLRQTSELLEILEQLQKRGVFAVPYKGPALALSVYGNLAFRRCIDLDVLVARADVPRTREILEGAGFIPQFNMSPGGREFVLKNRHSEIYTRSPDLVLELHWAFAKERGVFPVELEQLRPRLKEISLGGTKIPVFAPEDHLLILCVHGANHLWSRLEWLCGIAELMRNKELNWPEVLERAKSLRVERTLFLGTILAYELLDAPVPESTIEQSYSDKTAIRSATIVKKRLASGNIERVEPLNSWPRDVFRLRLQSTTGDKMRYLFHRITVPSREDTRLMLPLGRLSVPVIALFRPLRIIGKLIERVVRG